MLSLNATHALLAVVAASPDPAQPPPISAAGVALTALLVLADAAVSLLLGLNLHWQLATGVVRCIAQLTILGYVLGPIFTHKVPALVFGYAAFMVTIGASESAARPAHTYAGMTAHVVACLGVAAFAFLTYAMVAVVRPTPWWNAQLFVPTLGVMLGNAVSGVAVGLGALLDDLANGGDRVELLLALGASRREACRDAVARAVRLALTPILNQMNVIGLVWIPGMMTGQMIAGSDPSQAARYQMLVMFLVAATTASATAAVVGLAAATLVDADARLRRDRLRSRSNRHGWAARCVEAVKGAWSRRGERGREEGETPLLGSSRR